jgi:hypothetical protein
MQPNELTILKESEGHFEGPDNSLLCANMYQCIILFWKSLSHPKTPRGLEFRGIDLGEILCLNNGFKYNAFLLLRGRKWWCWPWQHTLGNSCSSGHEWQGNALFMWDRWIETISGQKICSAVLNTKNRTPDPTRTRDNRHRSPEIPNPRFSAVFAGLPRSTFNTRKVMMTTTGRLLANNRLRA